MNNPFPRISIPTEPQISFDPDGVLERIMKYISDVIDEGSKGCITIVGNYGQGKTHLMLEIMSSVSESNNRSISIYVPSPGRRFRDLYQSVVLSVLESIDLLSLRCTNSATQLCTVISALRAGERSNEALNWLLGEPVSASFRKKYSLRNNRLEISQLRTLKELLNLLRDNGFSPIVVLLDELEILLSYTSGLRLQYLNDLRNFIDDLPALSVLVVATTPAGWMEIINTHPALSRRLSSTVIYLRNLELEEIIGLLDAYLARINMSTREVFEEDVIQQIYEITEGNPGEVLRIASILFDIYLQKGSALSSSDSIVTEVLSRYV